jgi:class 3 adenylate cyclase/tetratricopeptide (TPR) repeat protein
VLATQLDLVLRRGDYRAIGERVAELISLAEAAGASARWLDALDYASQALAEDPSQTAAAAMVGTARRRLGAISGARGELRQVTVVAVDMHRSTAIAAQVGPELMRELMLEVYEVCIDAVARYEGHVTKYLGDGILGQFGYPIAHEDDARRAVLASLEVLDAVAARAAEWEARFGAPVTVRIGIDSGVVAVGPVDASPWSSEDIAGDPPNIASRVQATAERMTVRVTDATKALVQGWFETVPVGPVDLRNYPEPVGLHRVIGPTRAETRLEARGGARPPLLGREAELAALRTAWSHVVATGERRVMSLTGEAGIGKSRLVEHLIATATASGGAHVTFACSRLHQDSALRPVARAVARFFSLSPRERDSDALALDAIRRQLEQLANRRVATEDAVPIYGWLLGLRSAVDLEPIQLRWKTFDAVIDLLEAMSIGTPLVLCADDVDTADPSTVELLRILLARPATPMLIVLAGRGSIPDLTDAGELLELASLAGDDAAALVRAVAPRADDDTVRRLVEGSGGVPYFLEEQARAAQESPDGAVAAPLELSVFLSARLDELGSRCKSLLGEIAVAGEGIRLDVLSKMTQVPAGEVDVLLDELCRRRVLVREWRRTGEIVRFRHGLMREAAIDGLLAVHRAELHRQLAALLAQTPGAARPEDLAHHYEAGGDPEHAARCWLEAGRVAAGTGASTEAITLFRRSLSALDDLPEGAERTTLELDVQLGLGTAASALEGYTSPNARAAFERAVALGERLGDTATIFPALWGTSSYWFVLGEHRLDHGLVERLVRIAEEQQDPRFRFEAAFVAGYRNLHLGDLARARDELERATQHLGLEPIASLPEDSGIVSRSTLSIVLWLLGEPARSAEAASEALRLVDALDPTARRAALTTCWVHSTLAWRAELAGDSQLAVTLAERSAGIAADRHFLTWLGAATLHRSIALCRLGRFEEGLPILTAMVDAWRAAGRDATGRQLHPMLMSPYFAGRLAEAWLATGDVDGAARLVDELLAETARSGERFWDAALLKLRAAAASALGAAPDAVRADLDAARALARDQGALALADALEGSPT